MKRITARQQALTVSLAAAVLTAGCAAPSSNTQRGAAGGAAVGALAGAIIGNNRGSGNAASGAAIGAAAGAIAGGALGHAKDTREGRAATNSSYGYGDATNIVVQGPPPLPPAPIAEVVTQQPTSNAVWVPGYWSYENGNSYVWVAGHWEIPPQGYRTYQPPHWVQQGGNSVYVRGTWR